MYQGISGLMANGNSTAASLTMSAKSLGQLEDMSSFPQPYADKAHVNETAPHNLPQF